MDNGFNFSYIGGINLTAKLYNKKIFSYIGGTNISAKHKHGEAINVATYCVYLMPAKASGYNVCAKSTKECEIGCLVTSGRVIMDKRNIINNARLNRTKAFYDDRENFMKLLIKEIALAKGRAKRNGQLFTVRLNGTSDLSPELFKYKGKTLLEIFPDVQFYDYTKILNRSKLVSKYPNYDLTFSYTGYNWDECEQAISNKIRVAVIFDIKKGQPLPSTFNGYKVIDGDKSDYRPADKKNVIVGLRFKRIANKVNEVLVRNSPFVVKTNNQKKVVTYNVQPLSLAA